MTHPNTGRWPDKHAARALLGYLLDIRLSGAASEPGLIVPSPWDAWWASYRAGLPLTALTLGVGVRDQNCLSCAPNALGLAATSPPSHPGTRATGLTSCGCLLEWAEKMRAPGPQIAWPPVSLSLALIKPGAPTTSILRLLAAVFEMLTSRQVTLTAADTRRMYPEAYGADYVHDRDAYLTSGPVHIAVMRARGPVTDPGAIKRRIRAHAGGDELRNHLHMPDNPGEALADIAHFAGHQELAQLYRRYERDHTAQRLAFYRAALGISPARADRLPAAG